MANRFTESRGRWRSSATTTPVDEPKAKAESETPKSSVKLEPLAVVSDPVEGSVLESQESTKPDVAALPGVVDIKEPEPVMIAESVKVVKVTQPLEPIKTTETIKPVELVKPVKNKGGRPTATYIPDGDHLIKTGFKLPSTVYERLREVAWRERLSMNSAAAVAIEAYLSEKEKQHGIKRS